MATPLVNAREWPSGLTLTWSSLGRWTYRALDEHGQENTLVLPVPPLAAPCAVSAVLPALMDGRHGLLPSSQDLWEHAGLAESSAASSLRFGDDKYDEAFQAAEEEAEAFLRWQKETSSADAVELERVEVPAVQEGGSSAPQEVQRPGEGVLLDPDGVPLPPVEEASLNLLVQMLGVCGELAEEMGREPYSFSVHAGVLLAQYARVASVGQWIGLAATALRRDLQEDLGRVPAPGAVSGPGEAGGLSRYRVVAQCTVEDHPGAATLTHFAYAASVEEAVARVRAAHEGPGGVYGERGLYRVVEVAEEGPSSEERQEEVARRRFVTTVLNAAIAASPSRRAVEADPEMFGVLCDYFTRAVVFPGQLGFPCNGVDEEDGMHTSDPGRALSQLLLEHLCHHGLVVEAGQAEGVRTTREMPVDERDEKDGK
ncbi:hypothetical protein [Streptomyces cinereoruber]|uniref:hypothetical protein n=1 Tax=Streptomyces cinereoruber TaxID=67260 RepID=UPI00362D5C5C